ncbi:hypothetical protein [Pseudobacteroides cellulosolvens]|uniref:Uncharacterized protein n=1 Tax=Pseudobacteroides cellulosolvens ATCC 35603 = DSM 2933 TaxID=398512 RepID=A0A0L6JMG2_9FIRM|nr:hypothetical protein [Pseudobacteroides cellulosolvens]KNY26577.1 hypothetical protein Bccel_1842 [Pseudobacteroides cellulosolvens ATCC 35603 = DSM 2933]
MHRKEKRIVIALSILLAVVLGIAVKFYIDYKAADKRAIHVSNSYVDKNKELSNKIEAVDKRINELNERYYEDKLSKLLGAEQIISLQKAQWKYSLKANETPFTENHIYIHSRDIVLTLTESQKEEKVLPISMHKKGSLVSGDDKDNFYDHMIIKSDIPFEKKVQIYNNYTNVFYSFKNLSVGTVITLVLSEPLKDRLNLHFDRLEIIVDKIDENS